MAHSHAGGHSTAVTAFSKIAAGVPALKLRILADIDEAGEDGITPDEWCDRNGALINTVRRRFTDLWKDGLIRHHPAGLTAKNSAGNECVRWVAGCDPAGTAKRAGVGKGFLAGMMYATRIVLREPDLPAVKLALRDELLKASKRGK